MKSYTLSMSTHNIQEFSDCADACVKDVRSSTLDSLQGYDWDCDNRKVSSTDAYLVILHQIM